MPQFAFTLIIVMYFCSFSTARTINGNSQKGARGENQSWRIRENGRKGVRESSGAGPLRNQSPPPPAQAFVWRRCVFRLLFAIAPSPRYATHPSLLKCLVVPPSACSTQERYPNNPLSLYSLHPRMLRALCENIDAEALINEALSYFTKDTGIS